MPGLERGWHLRNLVHRGDDGCEELVGHGEEAAEGDAQSSLDLGVAQGLLWSDVVGEVAVAEGEEVSARAPPMASPPQLPPFELHLTTG